jgi:hypothetical protein
MSHGMSRRISLQTAAHRLRRWLPVLTVLWVLAASVAVLQPCRDAFAASLPHPHGPQVASAEHAHSHGPGDRAHHPADDACQCAELAPPFTATALDEGTLPRSEGATAVSPLAAAAGASGPDAIGARYRATPHQKHPRYLTTSRLRI